MKSAIILTSRIIPARAGFTGVRGLYRAREPDHPRSRGVYVIIPTDSGAGHGSSPLARGLQHIVEGFVLVIGIIPARAGFTAGRRARRRPAGDHPRSRGVYGSCASAAPPRSGSSPLARGLHNMPPYIVLNFRIIPARAGFTLDSSGVSGHTTGSSPLARGLRWSRSGQGSGTGIIPARAGFTASPWMTRRGGGDHPRSRGVYRSSLVGASLMSGSSPLARGLREAGNRVNADVRIIPARAGFTRDRPTA